MKLDLFDNDPGLLKGVYDVRSTDDVEAVRSFVSAVAGEEIEITEQNAADLRNLCDEFCFSDLEARVLEFSVPKPWSLAIAGWRAILKSLMLQTREMNAYLQNRAARASVLFGPGCRQFGKLGEIL